MLQELAPGVRWRLEGPVGRTRKCIIYRLSAPEHASLALKQYKPGVASAAAPGLQYEALMRCQDAAATGSPVPAPQAHAFAPDIGAVLMEWVDAPQLRTLLWRTALRPGHRRRLITRTARWLRSFHDLSPVAVEPLDGTKLLRKLQGKLDASAAAPLMMHGDPLFREALAAFTETAQQGGLEAPHALLHGDFTPSNILIDKGDVIGIDMWGARRGPVLEDIARMLTYLAIVSPFALARAPLAAGAPLMSAFAEGYGHGPLKGGSKAVNFVMLYQQLRRWQVYADRRMAGTGGPVSRWQQAQARALVRQTLRQL